MGGIFDGRAGLAFDRAFESKGLGGGLLAGAFDRAVRFEVVAFGFASSFDEAALQRVVGQLAVAGQTHFLHHASAISAYRFA